MSKRAVKPGACCIILPLLAFAMTRTAIVLEPALKGRLTKTVSYSGPCG